MKTLGIKENNVCRWTYDQFVTEAQGTDVTGFPHGNHTGVGKHWDLGVEWPEALKRATQGDNMIASSAGALLDKLQINTQEDTAFKTTLGVTGGSVCVPAYLTSHPESMISRQRRARPTRQVNLYVCINSSAGVNAGDLLKRGTAVLALLEALRLQQVSVDLFLVSVLGGVECQYATIEIPSRPLDLSTVGFAIAHPAFDRHLLHGLSTKFGYCGGWARDISVSTVRRVLGLQPGDIYLPEVLWNDREEIKNPQAWLDKHVSQITTGNEV